MEENVLEKKYQYWQNQLLELGNSIESQKVSKIKGLTRFENLGARMMVEILEE